MLSFFSIRRLFDSFNCQTCGAGAQFEMLCIVPCDDIIDADNFDIAKFGFCKNKLFITDAILMFGQILEKINK